MKYNYFKIGLNIILEPIKCLLDTSEVNDNSLENNLQELEEQADDIDPINQLELFRSNCGDIILSDIIRIPDLTAILYVVCENDIYGPYKRKIKYNNKVRNWYFMMDGEKWYFRKKHEQLYLGKDYAEEYSPYNI